MRGFIAAVHLCAALYIGAMWYRPAPAVARPVASWLDPNKPHQDRFPVKAIPTIAYRLDPPVIASVTATPEHSLPWSCDAIRNAVAGKTPEQIEQLARMYRLRKWQRAEARKCLKKENA